MVDICFRCLVLEVMKMTLSEAYKAMLKMIQSKKYIENENANPEDRIEVFLDKPIRKSVQNRLRASRKKL